MKYALVTGGSRGLGRAVCLKLAAQGWPVVINYQSNSGAAEETKRLIEEQGLADELHFQGSICGDGPYDLVTTMRYYLEDDGTSYGVETEHRKGTSTYPVVAPLIMKSMLETHPAMAPYKREDFMSQQFLDTGVCDWIDSKEYTTTDINEMWYNQVKTGVDTQGRHYTPEQMTEMFSTPSSSTVIGNLDKMFTQAVLTICRMTATSTLCQRTLPMRQRLFIVPYMTILSPQAGNRSTAYSSTTRSTT